MPTDLNPFVLGNLIESCVWAAMGVGVLIKAATLEPRPPLTRRLALVAGLTLLAFGVSDVVETTTGAWWRPWWLLTWKSACVAVLTGVIWRIFRARRAGTP